LADHERTLDRLVETLKEPVRIDPQLDRRVMAAIAQDAAPAAEPKSGLVSMVEWLRRRRTIEVSPLSGLAAAAALAALFIAGNLLLRPPEMPVSVVTSPGAEPTQFVLVAPEAASVTVVGDFNDWNATPLAKQDKDGVWWVTLSLPPGRYRYAFVVNGSSWRGDPQAPTADDEFGRPSSVVTIGG